MSTTSPLTTERGLDCGGCSRIKDEGRGKVRIGAEGGKCKWVAKACQVIWLICMILYRRVETP